MSDGGKKEKILVISNNHELPDMIKGVVGTALEVIHIPNHEKALDIARRELPVMIVMGYIEPQGTAFQLYRKFQDGWITKNTLLLVIESSSQDPSKHTLSTEEGQQIGSDEYIILSDTESTNMLKERLQKRLREQANTFKEAILNPDVFCVTWEQIPGRGAFELQQEEVIENARKAKAKGKIHAISVTDNPSGSPAISAAILCTEIKRLGIEPLVHFAFRDKNRNQCEGLLYGLAALGVRDLLILTGDYPSTSGFKGRGKPVFDLDSVNGLQLVEVMNHGLEHEAMGKKYILAPTDFFAGAAVSPFKQSEPELMGQYYKVKKKIEAGAKFLITQVGYDARKLHELIQWLKVNGYKTPVLANIYILPYGTGRAMNANQLPGCVVTDKLLKKLDEERDAKDKGRQSRLDRAAKMYAIAKGLGYNGV
ncbi:MAG: methylenetetrahydrofolate reductase, partial [Chloroflexi bacterium]|nr:methylenetetrahydrofolate reductase [Chloroflexota bacterium]